MVGVAQNLASTNLSCNILDSPDAEWEIFLEIRRKISERSEGVVKQESDDPPHERLHLPQLVAPLSAQRAAC